MAWAAALVPVLAAATSMATQIYSATRKQPRMPEAPGIPKADLASMGAMRSDMFGSATPSFQAGLQGAPTGPIPGAGGATTGPIVGANDYSTVLAKMLGGGGGGLGSGDSIGG